LTENAHSLIFRQQENTNSQIGKYIRMAFIHVQIETQATPENCWTLLKDYQNIDFFNPYVARSFLLDEHTPNGIGALRQCNFKDGKNYIKERIIDWQEGKSFTVDIYEGTMPVNDIKTSLGIKPRAMGGAQLYMHMEYTPKWGFFGAILNRLMMTSQFEKMARNVLLGLDQKATLANTTPQRDVT